MLLRDCVPGASATDTETRRPVRVVDGNSGAPRGGMVLVEREDNMHQYWVHHRHLKQTRRVRREKAREMWNENRSYSDVLRDGMDE